jgi:hypothetical protein
MDHAAMAGMDHAAMGHDMHDMAMAGHDQHGAAPASPPPADPHAMHGEACEYCVLAMRLLPWLAVLVLLLPLLWRPRWCSRGRNRCCPRCAGRHMPHVGHRASPSSADIPIESAARRLTGRRARVRTLELFR